MRAIAMSSSSHRHPTLAEPWSRLTATSAMPEMPITSGRNDRCRMRIVVAKTRLITSSKNSDQAGGFIG